MFQDIIEIDKNKLSINKSNTLIRAKYDLSVVEYRVIHIGIAYVEDTHNRTVEIPVSDYKKLLGLEHFNYQHLVDVLKKLRERSIVTAKVNEKTGELEEGYITGWVDSVRYNSGRVRLTYNEDIWEYIVNLVGEYKKFNLPLLLKLKSKYSIRIYEILKSYEYIGFYNVNIDTLREMFILGEKYSRFNDFEKYILLPAVTEINELNDIIVSYTPKKSGRKYTSVVFKIKIKENTLSDVSELPPEVQAVRNMSEIELFASIKSILSFKYKVLFTQSDIDWNDVGNYTKYALEVTYLGLMDGKWDNHQIPHPKGFFAEHLRRESEKGA
jgi:plasmid replication initiation protein